jgi:hypothetical protein
MGVITCQYNTIPDPSIVLDEFVSFLNPRIVNITDTDTYATAISTLERLLRESNADLESNIPLATSKKKAARYSPQLAFTLHLQSDTSVSGVANRIYLYVMYDGELPQDLLAGFLKLRDALPSSVVSACNESGQPIAIGMK